MGELSAFFFVMDDLETRAFSTALWKLYVDDVDEKNIDKPIVRLNIMDNSGFITVT